MALAPAAGSDEEAECRICRGGEEPRRPLFHPCKCSGSIKYTHEDCLGNWLAQAGTARCELCNHPFRFEPLYEPNTPPALSPDELAVGVLVRVCESILTAARVALVLTVWLFLLPLGTCWTWYALFINSLARLPSLITGRGLSGVVTDAFYGCLLSAGIVFVFLGVSSLREYIRKIPDDAGDPANLFLDDLADIDDLDLHNHHLPHRHRRRQAHRHRDPQNHDGPVLDAAAAAGPAGGADVDNLVDDDERDAAAAAGDAGYDVDYDGDHSGDVGEEVAVAAADPNAARLRPRVRRRRRRPRPPHRAPPPPPQPARAHDYDDDWDDARGDEDADYDGDKSGSDLLAPDDSQDAGGLPPVVSSDEGGVGEAEGNRLVEGGEGGGGGGGGGEGGEGGEGGGGGEGGEGGHPHHHDEDAPVGALDDNLNEDGGALFGLFELDPDEVPLEEMVGLRGHPRNLFDNAGTMLVSNAVFLGIFTLIPLLVGRLALRVASLRTFPLDLGTAAMHVASPDLLNASAEASDAVDGTVEAVASRLATAAASALGAAHDEVDAVTAVVAEEPLVSYVDNLFVVLLGYGVISLCAFGYVIVNSLLRSRYPHLDTPMTRQVARVLRYLATFVKIVVLIVFEFGVFPLGCGWWLDVCALNIIDSTFESRVSFCREFPWTSTAGHWFLGIFYMVHLSLFISLLRDVLRPELLWFMRDPEDPDFRPFCDLVEKPLARHASRLCLSMAVYVPLIFAVVYVPGQLCLTVLPEVFPFKLSDFSHSLVEVPFGNLLVVPLVSIVHHTRPGTVLRRVVRVWIERVGSAIGIDHLVLHADLRAGEVADGAQVDADDVDDAEMDGDVFAPFEGGDGGSGGSGGEAEGDGIVPAAAARALDQPAAGARYPESAAQAPAVTDEWVRGLLMLFLAWLTLVITECVTLTVPTVVGRYLMGCVGLSVSHDLYAFGVGIYVSLGASELASRAYKFLSSVDTQTAVMLALPYALVVAKSLILVFFWFGVAPLGAGLLVELMITIPVRVAHNESPCFFLHQDWALGLLLIKVWTRIVLAGGFDTRWRERLERAREGGLLGAGVHFGRTWREVIGPVLGGEAVALAVPYAFSHGLLRALGASAAVTSIVYRYVYLWCMFVYAVRCTVARFKSGLLALHDSIRDDKYLVGKRLYNYGSSRVGSPASP